MNARQKHVRAAAGELKRLLGAARIETEAARLSELGGDKWFAHHQPDLAAYPRSSADVSKIMKIAARHGLPVTTRGAGYGYVGSCVPSKGGIVLAMQRMNRIKEISPADFVAVVEPGVITGDLQAEVRKKKPLLSARSGEPEKLQPGRQYRDQCGRAALFEIRSDPPLCAGIGGSAGQWRHRALWRAHPQKQDRL